MLGTSFNVKAHGGDDDIVAVTLDEGREIFDDRHGGRFELSPSEQLLHDRRLGERVIVRGADAMRHSIWKDDVISFPRHAAREVPETLLAVVRRAFPIRRTQPRNPYPTPLRPTTRCWITVFDEMEPISRHVSNAPKPK